MNKSSNIEKVILIITYLLSSMMTTVVNKYVISVLNFNMLFLYLAIQSMFITSILLIMRSFKIIDARSIKNKRLFSWTPCSILLGLMIYTGAKSMVYLPISLFTLFKNFSIIITAYCEKILYGQKIGIWVISSFVLMIVSSSIGEYSDFTTTFFGYLWSGLNVFSTSAYILLLKFNIDTQNASNYESVLYCNLISIPFLLFGSFLIDTFDKRIFVVSSSSVKLFSVIFASSFLAFMLAYSTVWCLKDLSSTTLSMLGAMNKLIVSLSGIIFLKEKNVTFLKLLSLFVGSLASLLYLKRVKDE